MIPETILPILAGNLLSASLKHLILPSRRSPIAFPAARCACCHEKAARYYEVSLK